MGLLLQCLSMIILLMWFFCLPALRAQSTNGSLSPARALDAMLQDYAYRAFGHHPKTGNTYYGDVPSNLAGIKIAAMRLRRGSLYRKGVPMYNEFHIPTNVSEQPYVQRLVLVYQNLGNWSTTYYQLSGYTHLTPVLGLLAYSASNLSATELREVNITATVDPISITFSHVSAPDGAVAQCVWFDLYGEHTFSNLSSDNKCSTIHQGHFSIVFESIAPTPSAAIPTAGPRSGGEGKKNNSKVGIIVGSVLGGLALLMLLTFLVLWVQKFKHRKKMQQMERAADVGEALHMTLVGNTKAPAATVTRTPPAIETEYMP